MILTDEQINRAWDVSCVADPTGSNQRFVFARAIESAATAPLLERIAGLERDMAAMTAKLTVERSHSAELERELEAVRKDAGWRGIETAPDTMTGTVVVRWVNSDGEECRELDYKEDGCWIGWHEHAEHVEIIGGHGVSYTPPYTGWMPLPLPPDAAKEQG